MKDGYIKLFRKLMDKSYYKNSEYVHLWVHILLKANHKKNKFLWNNKEVEIKKGQFITSRKTLSEETGINQSKIERILKFLKTEQQIEQQNLHTSRLITINNYSNHQQSEHLYEQQVNSKRTASEQQVNTNNKDKNDKNDKKKNKPLAPDDKKHHPKPTKINFNFETSNWENIKEEDRQVWEEAFPKCIIEMELKKMKSWLIADPKRKKTQYKRFINSWLSRQQDGGGTKGIPDDETWAERSERKEKP